MLLQTIELVEPDQSNEASLDGIERIKPLLHELKKVS
jgi:hypothetical protein